MAEQAIGDTDTPFDCEDTLDYDDRMQDYLEIEPKEEQQDRTLGKNWEEIERQFARYERNYRARRIRELTMAPRSRRSRKRRITELAL